MTTPLFSASTGSITAGQTLYAPVSGTLYTPSATEDNFRQICSPAGSATAAYVELSAAPGSGKSIVCTLRVNGVDSALVVTVADLATSGSATGSISVAAADKLTWKIVSSASATTTVPRITTYFAGTTAKDCPIMGHFAPTAASRYWCLSGYPQDSDATEAKSRQICSPAGDLKNFRVELSVAPGGANSRTFTIYVNGSASLATITISGASTSGSYTATNIAISAGDKITLRAEIGSSPAATRAYVGATLTVTTDGEAPLMGSEQISVSASAVNYLPLMMQSSATGWSATDDRFVVAGAFTIKNLYMELGTAPGVGKSFTLTANKNASATALTAAVSGTNTTANDTTHTFTTSSLDDLSISSTPAGTPTVPTYFAWGVTVVVTTSTAWTQTESSTATTTTALAKTATKVLSNTIASTTAIIRATTKAIANAIASTTTALRGATKVVLNTITATTAIEALRTLVKALTDTITATDSLVRAFSRSIANSVTSTTAALHDATKTFLETITSTTAIDILRGAAISITETITATTAVVRSFARAIAESLTTTTAAIKTAAKTTLETITATTAISFLRTKILLNAVVTTTSLVRTVSRSIAESAIATTISSVIRIALVTILNTITSTTAMTTARTLNVVVTSIARAFAQTRSIAVSLNSILINLLWRNRTKPSATWTKRTKPTSIWRKRD